MLPPAAPFAQWGKVKTCFDSKNTHVSSYFHKNAAKLTKRVKMVQKIMNLIKTYIELIELKDFSENVGKNYWYLPLIILTIVQ